MVLLSGAAACAVGTPRVSLPGTAVNAYLAPCSTNSRSLRLEQERLAILESRQSGNRRAFQRGVRGRARQTGLCRQVRIGGKRRFPTHQQRQQDEKILRFQGKLGAAYAGHILDS